MHQKIINTLLSFTNVCYCAAVSWADGHAIIRKSGLPDNMVSRKPLKKSARDRLSIMMAAFFKPGEL